VTNEFINVGTMAVAKVGRNEIEVEIIAVEDGTYTVRNKSGKVFRARRVEPMPVPEPAESTEPETEIEDDTPNPAPESGKPEKHLSLLDAAIEVLQRCPAGTALNTRDMVKEATAQQLWFPTACQTPEQTLYGAIFREIKMKEQPRIVKADAKGKFRLA